MEPKRVGRANANKIIRYKPKKVVPKPPDVTNKPEDTPGNEHSAQKGCFRITKPDNASEDTNVENDTKADQSGCAFEINKPVVSTNESPEIDPNHRYAVC